MNSLTKETKTLMAIHLVLTDAIDKGHTCTEELIAYMKSKTFEMSVKSYILMMDKTNFPDNNLQ